MSDQAANDDAMRELQRDRLAAETRKFIMEATKLLAEARKLDRDRTTGIIVAVAAVTGAITGVITFVASRLGQ